MGVSQLERLHNNPRNQNLGSLHYLHLPPRKLGIISGNLVSPFKLSQRRVKKTNVSFSEDVVNYQYANIKIFPNFKSGNMVLGIIFSVFLYEDRPLNSGSITDNNDLVFQVLKVYSILLHPFQNRIQLFCHFFSGIKFNY